MSGKRYRSLGCNASIQRNGPMIVYPTINGDEIAGGVRIAVHDLIEREYRSACEAEQEDEADASLSDLIQRLRGLQSAMRDERAAEARASKSRPDPDPTGLAYHEVRAAKKRMAARAAKGLSGADLCGARPVIMMKQMGWLSPEDVISARAYDRHFDSTLLRQSNFGRASLHDLLVWVYSGGNALP